MKPFTIVAFALACLTVAVYTGPAQAVPHANMHTSMAIEIAAGGCRVRACVHFSLSHQCVAWHYIWTSPCSARNPNVMGADRFRARNPSVLSVPDHGGGGPHQSTGKDGSIIWQRQNNQIIWQR
jgi:hypothetical protein